MTYTVRSETPKALLLANAEGMTFWVQRRWMRSDGTLTPAGVAAEQKAEDRLAEAATLVEMPLDWQNEKSVGIDYRAEFTLSSSIDARPRRVRAFVSKSQVELTADGTVKLPIWLERKLRREALSRAQDREGLHHGYQIVSAWSV